MRTAARAALGVGVAAVVLALLVTTVGWREFADALAAAELDLYLVAVVASVTSLLAWAQVARRLFESVGGRLDGVGFHAAYFSALFGRAVIPGGHVGGVGIIAYVLSRYGDGEFERPLVAISAAEFSNTLASATVATVGLVFVVAVGHGGSFSDVGAVVIVGMLVALAAAYVLVVEFAAVGAVVRRLAGALRATVGRVSARARHALRPENVEERISRARDVVDALRSNPRTLATAVLFSHLGWALYVLPLWFCLRAVDAPVAFPALLFVVPLAGLTTVVGTPGGIGVVDSAITALVLALTPYEPGAVVAAALLYRVADYGTTILVGGVATAYLASADVRSPIEQLRG